MTKIRYRKIIINLLNIRALILKKDFYNIINFKIIFHSTISM